jgi:hypothetical protein
MKPHSVYITAKWTARLLMAMTVFVSLGISAGISRAAEDPDTSTKIFLPFAMRSGAGLVPLTAQCVDCPRNISGMTGQSLRMDSSSHPHIAYGSDHLYHAWNDGTGWKTEVVDPAPGTGYAASLAFDNTGKAGISYYDDYNHSLKLARWSGTSWILQTVDTSPFAGFTSSLAFNSAGYPRIAYEDYDSAQAVFRIKYVEWNGAAWSFYPTIDHTEEYRGTTLSLALDQSGGTHISYWRSNYDVVGGLIYASWTSGAWALQIVEEDTETGRDNSLAFDSLGKPHISYFNDWDGLVRYASLNETVWTTETVFGSGLAMDKNNATSLTFGTADMPMIAFSLGSDPTQTLVWLAYKSGGVWHHDQDHDIVGSAGARWPAIAADSNGKPQISYVDYNTGQLHFSRLTAWNPDTWSNATIDSGAQVGQGTSLAMSATGLPHIAYMDLTHGVMKYATQVMGMWQASTVNVPGMKPAHGHALAVDTNGIPHIAYSDTAAKKIMYATLNGANWTAEVVTDDTGSDIEKYISLALDASNNPHISFFDAAFSGVDLKYAHKTDAGPWQVSEVDKDAVGITGQYNSIAIDSSGKPHISYYNVHSGHLWYASWNGAAWEKILVDDGYQTGRYTSLVLDSLNHPHICYSDHQNYYVKYATFNGSAWTVSSLTPADPGNSDDRASVCSIKVGSGNVPYISYFRKIDRHLAMLHPVSGSWVSEMVDANGDTGEHNSLAMYNGVPYIAYYHTSNKDLQFMMWKP